MRICFKWLLMSLFTLYSINLSAQTAKRIVSLSPQYTKAIYQLGAGDLVVGCTSYCTVDANNPKPIVASAIDVNVERVFMLKPDLVITSELTKPSVVQSLRDLGLTVKSFSTPKSFDDICANLIEVGVILGIEDKAKAIVTEHKLRLKTVVSSFKPSQPNLKFFFQIGASPLFTVIPNTFMNDYITLLGGVNIANDLKGGSITRESVLVKNPDVIIIITMGIVGEEEMAVWSSYKQLSASQKKLIFSVNADKACSPTTIDFIETIEAIANHLNSNK